MAKNPPLLHIPAPVSGQPQASTSAFVATTLYPASAVMTVTGNQLFAPLSGTVVAVDVLNHSVQLKATNGLVVLLRVGVDTHALHTQGCVTRVRKGQQIAQGQVLLSFNLALIKQHTEALALVALTNLLNISKLNVSSARQCLAVEDTLFSVTLPAGN